LLIVAALLATALLAYFGTGLHPLWPLLWFAPVPVLTLAPRLGAGRAFLMAFVAWLLGQMNEWRYLTHGIQLPVPLILISFAIAAALFGLGVLLVRGFLRRGSIFLAALSFPLYLATYEYVVSITSPHSTFGNLAYTQINCLPVIQIASITGIWGISFIVFLFATTVAVLLSGVGEPRRRRALAVTVGAVVCLVLLFGEWRLRQDPPGKSVTVTCIGKDEPMALYLGSEQQALQLFREYADEVRRATPAATDVVVLPEKIGRVSENGLAEVDALFSSAAAATHAAVDLGVVRRTATVAFNSSRLYSPNGKLEVNYDKHHLLSGVEPETPGHERALIDQPSGRWGLEICKDMDFPKLSREYAGDGANLLLVPAWDFGEDGWAHGRMAILRGVENGFAIARAARNGILSVSDDRGRVLAEKATRADQFVAITTKVNVDHEATLYTKLGDWFAWICVAGFVALVLSRFLGR
jgi:apolipoprotein N-acyltransferase